MECPICFEQYTEVKYPKVTTCGHIFCVGKGNIYDFYSTLNCNSSIKQNKFNYSVYKTF